MFKKVVGSLVVTALLLTTFAFTGGQASAASTEFLRPVDGGITTTNFSSSHPGVDIADNGFVPVVAAKSGTVTRTKYDGDGYGYYVIVTHNINGQTWQTLYGHLKELEVYEGQTVSVGQRIGMMGNTGYSTGQHLHFEIHNGYWNGSKSNAVNPAYYMSYNPDLSGTRVRISQYGVFNTNDTLKLWTANETNTGTPISGSSVVHKIYRYTNNGTDTVRYKTLEGTTNSNGGAYHEVLLDYHYPNGEYKIVSYVGDKKVINKFTIR